MLIVETHATSHTGQVRRGNEDSYLLLDIAGSETWISSQDSQNGNETIIESQRFEVDANGIVLAVSDGMGGALAGEVASKMAVETVSEILLDKRSEEKASTDSFSSSLVGKLYDATVSANHRIHQRGRKPEFQGMGATFTGVAITQIAVDLVQIGDSRIYLIRNSEIFQITKDQSLVQQLIDSEQISPKEAETHALKNVILQALGAQNEIYPVASHLEPRRDDILLICSDGLSNKINSVDLRNIVLKNLEDLKAACVEFVEEANRRGGEDNITLILAKLGGDSLPEPANENIQLEILNQTDTHDIVEIMK